MLRFVFPLRFRQWLGPLLVAGAAGIALVVLVIVTGWVDLSAAEPHPDGWARFLHYTFERSTARHAAGISVPADLDSPIRIAAGARYYGQVCAHCHAGPGLGQNPVVLSMHPRPQYLATDLKLPGAQYSDAELFRIVKAGVKYSAMPSWPADGRDDEIWHMVAFLRVLPRLSPEQFRALALPPQPPASGETTRAFGSTPASRRYALRNSNEPPASAFAYRYPVIGFGENGLADDPLGKCSGCHGTDGAGGGAFPNLTLQDKSYIARALTAFANGSRQSAFMRVVASELSPRQIDALASYYAALPRKATPAPPRADPLGQQLALAGDASIGVGACAGCHGVNAAAAKAYPILEGQSAWYLANQMRLFRRGRGGLGDQRLMTAIARKLTDPQIDAIARYYAAQPPAVRQSFAALK